jgi:hypothetical protein
MSFNEAAIDALAAAVVRARDPHRLAAVAISAALSARPPAPHPAAAPRRSVADTQAAYQAHQMRMRSKYGDPQELMARLQSRGGGLSARVWS